MVLGTPSGRWPPIYDADELAQQISTLAGDPELVGRLYDINMAGPPACQGDIVELNADVPVLDEDGEPATFDSATYWLIVGNTCDFDRRTTEVAWTQLVPLIDVGESVPDAELQALRRYRHSRRFYIPPWPRAPDQHHRVADFLRPIALHKEAFVPRQVLPPPSIRQPTGVLNRIIEHFKGRVAEPAPPAVPLMRPPPAVVVARMTLLGWVLLHSCLIRFLARDDGRFD